jgi:hypothetical protein
MTTPLSHEVTQLLVAWSDGDQAALDQLTPLVYRELHRLAKEETAEALKVSPRTARREWSLACGWLRRELRQEEQDEA